MFNNIQLKTVEIIKFSPTLSEKCHTVAASCQLTSLPLHLREKQAQSLAVVCKFFSSSHCSLF